MYHSIETLIHVTLTEDEIQTILMGLGSLTTAQYPFELYEQFSKIYETLKKNDQLCQPSQLTYQNVLYVTVLKFMKQKT